MTQTVQLSLPSGKTLLAKVAGDIDALKGLGGGSSATRHLQDVADDLRETVATFAAKLDNLAPRAPDVVKLEFSFDIGTNGALTLLGAGVKGGITVSLTWDKTSSGG